jgi:hypothetical protein
MDELVEAGVIAECDVKVDVAGACRSQVAKTVCTWFDIDAPPATIIEGARYGINVWATCADIDVETIFDIP